MGFSGAYPEGLELRRAQARRYEIKNETAQDLERQAIKLRERLFQIVD
jgi:hypothetical protein